MAFRVIEAGSELGGGGYVLPVSGTVDGGAPVAAPGGADGRAAQAGVGSAPLAVQPAWGWGLAPARLGGGEETTAALTELPQNPALYTARQQDAVRRDLGVEIGDYMVYQPRPFVGR